MRKSQTKDTTGMMIWSLILLFLGEGLFSFGLYWPFLLSMAGLSNRAYWFGFIFGLLVSVATGTSVGLASLIIVVVLFLFGRVRLQMGNNLWLVSLFVVGVNLAADKLMGLSWSVAEGLANFLLAFFLVRAGYFEDDLRLSNR